MTTPIAHQPGGAAAAPSARGPRRRRYRLLGLSLAAGLGWLLMAPITAQTSVLEVTLCTDTTPVSVAGELRHAISNGGVRLILLPPCRITLSGSPGDDANARGDLDIVDAIVHLQGAGVDRTILDADQLDRVLDINNSFVTISDLTLTNGSAGAGGALRIVDSDVHLTRVAVTGSRASGGGYGGGIYIEAGSRARISDSTVADHLAGRGGGMAVLDSQLALQDSTVSGNRAAGVLDPQGGGLVVSAGRVELHQVTLSGNQAEGANAFGGGLRAANGSVVDAVLVTVTGNAAQSAAATGGGVFSSGSAVAFRGSIVAGNLPDNCGGPGPVSSGDHNLQDGASCPFTRLNDQSQPDPGLGPLAANGGLTATHLALPGSPALDRGPALGCPGLDQRGVSRPRDGDGDGTASCDVGAAEGGPRSAGRASLPRVIDPR